jgi:hypothetical protein
VTTYEGVEGLKKIYEDTLKERQPIDAFLQVSEIEPTMALWLNKYYGVQRTKLGIHARVLLSGDNKLDYIENSEARLRKVKLVNRPGVTFHHEVNIYADKVAYIAFKKDFPLIGILVRHNLIAETMRSAFQLMWDSI